MTLPRVVFFGGKGGVGKTTLAAAMAAGWAARGQKTLLLSTDPAHSLSDLLGQPLDDSPRELAPGLYVRELDPERSRDDYLAMVKDNIRQFAAPEFVAEALRQVDLTGQHPGVMESALFEALCRQLDEADRWDRLIVDTAPTGHTLHLLTLPEAMQAWTQALLARQAEAPSGNQGPGGNPRARVRQILEKRQTLFQRSRDRLQTAEECGFILVVNDDRLSVGEGVRAWRTLKQARVYVPALLVNRTTEPHAEVTARMSSKFPGLGIHLLPAHTPAPQDLGGLEPVIRAMLDSGLFDAL